MPLPTSSNVTDMHGGQSQADFVAVRVKSDISGYDIINSSAVATSPTFPASPSLPVVSTPSRGATTIAYSLTLLTDTQPKPTAEGALDIDYSNYEDTPELTKSLKPFATPVIGTSSSLKEYTLQNGAIKGGGVSSLKDLISINYLAYDSITGLVKVMISFGNLDPASFSASYKADDYSQPKVAFKGSIPEADIVIPAAMFDPRLVTVSTAQTLYRANGYYEVWLPKGSAL